MSEAQIYHQLQKEWSSGQTLKGVTDLLVYAADVYASHDALILPDEVITYGRLFDRVKAFAFQLQERGIRPGDHVALFISNSAEFYYAYCAIWWCGAVVVPLNTYLHNNEIEHILKDSDARLLVTSLEHEKRLAGKNVPTEAIEVLRARADADAQMLESPVALSGDTTAVILYTSGTTGVPKGVVLSSNNVMANTLQVRARLAVVVGDKRHRFFGVLPLFHAFAQVALVWLACMTGSSVIVVGAVERRAIRAGLLQKPTIFFGFPALYGLLLMMRTAPLDSVELFVSGADALADKIRMGFALLYGRKICSGYGLTEASPVIAVDGHGQEHASNVVGTPLQDVVCQVRDDAGALCVRGTVGTLWVYGPNIMKGYYNAPDATRAVLKDGWLNTGDQAFVDEEGGITIVGRSKDLIINKGFNIYPQEVENVLLRHPAVFKAAVVGREESSSGQVPVAFVAVRSEQAVTEQEVLLFCKQNLAAYKVPRVITCRTDLPMTATGKIDKKQLQ